MFRRLMPALLVCAAACSGTTDADRITALEFRADTLRVVEGTPLALRDELRDQDGNAIPGGGVSWTIRVLSETTPNRLLAPPTLGADGVLTAQGMARAVVTAMAGSAADSVVVLAEPRMDSLTLNFASPPPSVGVGTALGIQATALQTRTNLGVDEVSPVPIRYESSNPQVVRIQPTTGDYTFLYRMVAVAPGTATVRVSYGGVSKELRMEVRQAPATALNTCALAADGTAWCSGANEQGALGTRTGLACGTQRFCTQQRTESPVRVNTELRFASVATGSGHSCALVQDGTAYCWGLNDYGQLGATAADAECGRVQGSSSTQFVQLPCSFSPVAVQGGLKFKTLQLSGAVSCGVALDDRRYCWGRGYGTMPTLQ